MHFKKGHSYERYLMNRKIIHSIRFGSLIDIQVQASFNPIAYRSTLFKFQ